MNIVNLYFEERCFGLFRSLRFVKKEDSYMLRCILEVLEKKFLNISWYIIRFYKWMFKGCCVYLCIKRFIRVESICLIEEVERILGRINI